MQPKRTNIEKNAQPEDNTPGHNMKTVKIGGSSFEILSHMTVSSMVECWRDDSEAFQQLARMIVETNPKFASEIVHAWLDKHGYWLQEKGKE